MAISHLLGLPNRSSNTVSYVAPLMLIVPALLFTSLKHKEVRNAYSAMKTGDSLRPFSKSSDNQTTTLFSNLNQPYPFNVLTHTATCPTSDHQRSLPKSPLLRLQPVHDSPGPVQAFHIEVEYTLALPHLSGDLATGHSSLSIS
jgi:hypothetical protein